MKKQLPYSGITVVSLEQAVAAPYATSRLAQAGARVIKIERPEGDFARGYDQAVAGEASYWVWLNQGKESVCLDLKKTPDLALMQKLIAKADVFVQNLAPGAAARLGLGAIALREKSPRLITCDISGYGEAGAKSKLKAYDFLVQAEAGLLSVSGVPEAYGRIGVSICDIGAGMQGGHVFVGLMTIKPAPPDMAEIMFATNQMLPAYVRRAMVERNLQNDDVIPRLHVSILLLAGDKDFSQPAPVLNAVAGKLAHGRVVLVPDAGHATFIDAPEAFERELRQFAAAVAPR